jgi:signal transduction histidine kinase
MKVIEKFMILYLLLFAVLSVLLAYTFITKEELEMKKIDEVLIRAALSINGELKKDFHNIATEKNSVTREEHKENSKRLTDLRRKFNLIYLYTAVEIEGNIYLTSTSTTDIDIKNNTAAEYFYKYDDVSSDLRKALKEKRIIFSEYKDNEGEYRAVFIPFERSDGEIYILAAEKDLNEIHSVINQIGFNIAVISTIIFILFVSVFLGYIKKSENKRVEIEKINALLEKKYIQKQNELEEAKDKLMEMNLTKDKLFSIVGHDIKGTIGNLMSISEFMAENGDKIESNNRKQIFDSINKSVEDAYFMVYNLFEWAKIQREGIVINQEIIRIKEVIEKTVKKFKSRLEDKKIEIEIRIKEDFLILADKNNIELILNNIISNSIKYSNENGEIIIEIDKIGNEISISVRDYGSGMKKEKLSAIFTLYENKFTYGTNGEHGAGLGIILCKELAEKNSGRIEINSEIDKGTEFKLYFKLI